ncbi:phage distal tail protein [Clostridium sp. MB05]|uniref:phage distal tail protein n=2 Tax=Clostridium TaxID=1485 RepID=UPI003982B889
MLINNIDISKFKAKLLERSIQNSNFEVNSIWLDSSREPFIDKNFTYKFKKLSFKLDLICKDSNELEAIKSNLTKELAIATIKFDDIDFYYRGSVTGDISVAYIMQGNETLDINMLVVAESKEVIDHMDGLLSKSINIGGNIEIPVLLEIIPTISMQELIIQGLSEKPIIIKNLELNKKVTIDGELSKITQDNINKFKDTDLWEFPRLLPGKNTITLNRNNCNITIRYKERWI